VIGQWFLATAFIPFILLLSFTLLIPFISSKGLVTFITNTTLRESL
jgi:hypothetical protein